MRLLDARTPGDGATRASAGVLAPYIEGHPASPLRDLGRESLDLYDAFIARLRDESHSELVYERSGTLEVALTVDEAERLSARTYLENCLSCLTAYLLLLCITTNYEKVRFSFLFYYYIKSLNGLGIKASSSTTIKLSKKNIISR